MLWKVNKWAEKGNRKRLRNAKMIWATPDIILGSYSVKSFINSVFVIHICVCEREK